MSEHISGNDKGPTPRRFLDVTTQGIKDEIKKRNHRKNIIKTKQKIKALLSEHPIDETELQSDIDTKLRQAELAGEMAEDVESIFLLPEKVRQCKEKTALAILRSSITMTPDRLPILFARIFSKSAADELDLII